jgi:hypothetical protein
MYEKPLCWPTEKMETMMTEGRYGLRFQLEAAQAIQVP